MSNMYVREDVIKRYQKYVNEYLVEEYTEADIALGRIITKHNIDTSCEFIKQLSEIVRRLGDTSPGYTIYDEDYMEVEPKTDIPILGQEVITPLGLGRIHRIRCDADGNVEGISVNLYTNELTRLTSFCFNSVELIDPKK